MSPALVWPALVVTCLHGGSKPTLLLLLLLFFFTWTYTRSRRDFEKRRRVTFLASPLSLLSLLILLPPTPPFLPPVRHSQHFPHCSFFHSFTTSFSPSVSFCLPLTSHSPLLLFLLRLLASVCPNLPSLGFLCRTTVLHHFLFLSSFFFSSLQ